MNSSNNSSFFWRNATINPNVSYESSLNIAPLNLFNGKIIRWSSLAYVSPCSYPSNCGPIFTSIKPEESKEYYDINQIDKYEFYWKCTENEAQDFLNTKYPELYKKYIDEYHTV